MEISVNPMQKITNIKIKNQSGQNFECINFIIFLQCMHHFFYKYAKKQTEKITNNLKTNKSKATASDFFHNLVYKYTMKHGYFFI